MDELAKLIEKIEADSDLKAVAEKAGMLSVLRKAQTHISTVEAEKDSETKRADRILGEKKKLQERIGETEKKLKDLESSSSQDEDEKAKENTRLRNELESLKGEMTELKGTLKTEKRTKKLADLRADIRWAEGVDAESANRLFDLQFGDDDDLEDKTITDVKVKEFREKNKALISTKAPDGTGTKSGDDKTPEPKSDEISIEERAKQLRGGRKAS